VLWVRSGVVGNVPGCLGITYRLVHTNRADSGVWELQSGCFLYRCASLQQGTRRSRDHQNRDNDLLRRALKQYKSIHDELTNLQLELYWDKSKKLLFNEVAQEIKRANGRLVASLAYEDSIFYNTGEFRISDDATMCSQNYRTLLFSSVTESGTAGAHIGLSCHSPTHSRTSFTPMEQLHAPTSQNPSVYGLHQLEPAFRHRCLHRQLTSHRHLHVEEEPWSQPGTHSLCHLPLVLSHVCTTKNRI
jgi:hypothetical protein